MKASLMDVGSILLLMAGIAGPDGPDDLAILSSAIAEESPSPAPKYTPIPASRKRPPSRSLDSEAESAPKRLAQQVGFESLPLASEPSQIQVRSEFTPLGSVPSQSAKFAAAPIFDELPSFGFAPTFPAPQVPIATNQIASQQTNSAQVPIYSNGPFLESGALHAPVARARVPTTIYGPPEPAYAYKPLVRVVPTPPTIHLGRGIVGQPTVYIPGQPVRNFFRYFSP
jgi:hypothetical protein